MTESYASDWTGQLRESAQKVLDRTDELIAAGVRQPETRRHHSSRSEREK